jgi:hypothetical protein
MAKKSSSTEVAVPKSTEVAAPIDLSAYTGMGMEGATQESFAIPFLGVLQKISPQCEETDAAYIEGAKAGQLFESVSKTLFDGKEGVEFVQCSYRRTFLRWAPRGSEGGGFKGELAPEVVAAMRDDGRLVEFEGRLYFPLDDGSINPKRCDFVADTRNHYLILLTEEGPRECLLSLTSTQIKKSKQLMTMLAGKKVGGKTLPTFATIVKATTALESNDKGQWHGINFSDAGQVTDPAIVEAALAFYKSVAAGTVKASYEDPEHAGSDKF